tara:strand:+ start:81 stop:863 length:783 start_codon:yes stop_codon:yes gene_type:complete
MNILNKIHNWTQSGPSANDKKIAPLLIAGAVAGLAGAGMKAYGAYQDSKWSPSVSPLGANDIRGQMAQSQAALGGMQGTVGQMGNTANQMMAGYDEMSGLGRDLMDPNSQVNQDQFNRMKTQGADQLALSTILNKRQAAASGLDSGIMAAQQRGQQQSLSTSLRDQFANQMATNRAQGIGVLGNAQSLLGNVGNLQAQMGGLQGDIYSGQMGIDSAAAQGMIAQNQWAMDEEQRKQNAKTDMFQSFGQGLQSFGTGLMGA